MTGELWFKRKKYGWGWSPANFFGWLSVLLYVAILVGYPWLAKQGYFDFSFFIFLAIIVVSSVLLIALCYAKGEKPTWQWGGK